MTTPDTTPDAAGDATLDAVLHSRETTTLDARLLPAGRKHTFILAAFEALQPGQALLLVNDHDPRPLRMQFRDRYGPDAFEWRYVEQGPTEWRVSIGRPAAGPVGLPSGGVRIVDLEAALDHPSMGPILSRSGRTARTVVRNGPLRATVVAIAPGGEIPEHTAAGPITVQPLQGRVNLSVGADEYALEPGEVLTLDAGIPHAVRSRLGARFLVTMALEEARVSPDGSCCGGRGEPAVG